MSNENTKTTQPPVEAEKKDGSITKTEIFCFGVITGLIAALALSSRSRC